MTYKEALESGWKEADVRLTQGYVSRKNFSLDEAECQEAGGYRRGQLFVLAPNFTSTRYCYRHYLVRDDSRVTRSWKVYGLEGHRQRESFHTSYNFHTDDGIYIRVENQDITGTNEYTIVRITAPSAEACEDKFDAQLSDGIFENCRTGEIEEITEA